MRWQQNKFTKHKMSGICTIAHITLLCGFVWRYGSRYPTWRFVWLRPTSGRNFSDSFKWITWSPKGSLSEVEMYYLDRVIVAKLRCEIGVRVSNLLLYFTTRRDHSRGTSTKLEFFFTLNFTTWSESFTRLVANRILVLAWHAKIHIEYTVSVCFFFHFN